MTDLIKHIFNSHSGLLPTNFRHSQISSSHPRYAAGMVCLVLLVSAVMTSSAHAEIITAGPPMPVFGVFYQPGWFSTTTDPNALEPQTPWEQYLKNRPSRHPMAGCYDDRQPRVWDYFSRWIQTHGIDLLVFDWYCEEGQERYQGSLREGFMPQAENAQLRFCLNWSHLAPIPAETTQPTPDTRFNPAGRWLRSATTAAEYFEHPQYFRHNDHPVLMIDQLETAWSQHGPETFAHQLQQLRKVFQDCGYPEIYLVAVAPTPTAAWCEVLKQSGFDAVTVRNLAGYSGPRVSPLSRGIPYPEFVESMTGLVLPFLSNQTGRLGLDYWPTVIPRLDERPLWGIGKGRVMVDCSTREFTRLLSTAVRFAALESPVILVDGWNYWNTGQAVEPSIEEGFAYLQPIHEVKALWMTTDSSLPLSMDPQQIVPNETVRREWAALSANQKPVTLPPTEPEQLPAWPTPGVRYATFGESAKPDPPVDPLIIDMATGSNWLERFQHRGLEIIDHDAEGLVFELNGESARLEWELDAVPTYAVRSITLQAEWVALSDTPSEATTPFQLPGFFWSTDLLPYHEVFNSLCRTQFPPLQQGTAILDTSNIMGWGVTGRSLNRIACIFGGQPGTRYRIRQLILKFSDSPSKQ